MELESAAVLDGVREMLPFVKRFELELGSIKIEESKSQLWLSTCFHEGAVPVLHFTVGSLLLIQHSSSSNHSLFSKSHCLFQSSDGGWSGFLVLKVFFAVFQLPLSINVFALVPGCGVGMPNRPEFAHTFNFILLTLTSQMVDVY